MAKEEILVVEDDADILELVRYNLAKEGYRVRVATSGEQALSEAFSKPPDLIILDLMLPLLDGLEVCKRLKRDGRTETVPVLILTAKGEESDMVAGLELGAEDYVPKPFSVRVLVARVRALLRRRLQRACLDDAPIEICNVTIHPGRREVRVDGEAVELTFTEFGILHVLARRPGWVFSRYQIVDAVRGQDYPVTDRAVDVQIVGLRKKLGRAGRHIKTVRGVGYKFQE